MRSGEALARKRLTYRDKQRIHKEALQRKRRIQARFDRRDLIVGVAFIAVSLLFLFGVLNSAYADYDSAFCIALPMFGVPSTAIVCYLVANRIVRHWREHTPGTRVTLLLGYAGLPVIAVLYGMCLLLLVNMWMPSESYWHSGAVTEKQIKRRYKSFIPTYAVVFETLDGKPREFHTNRERYRSINVGDSLTLRMWEGGLGWMYARRWVERSEGEAQVSSELLERLGLDSISARSQ